MPKLWSDTIDDHRRAVRDAILEATGRLVAKQGLVSLRMSHVAESTGIGRATLYKYFPDVPSLLVAWHERQVSSHLEHLVAVRKQHENPADGLAAVLEAYARMSRGPHGTELAAVLHRGEHVARAHATLKTLVRDLIAEGARRGDFRDDVAPDELAIYCLHALGAGADLASKSAVRRLVKVTLGGLHPPR